jgi:hypothetical protein
MILPRQARDKLKGNLRTTTRSSCFLQALAEYQTFLRTDIAQEVRHADRQAEQTRNALCPLPFAWFFQTFKTFAVVFVPSLSWPNHGL